MLDVLTKNWWTFMLRGVFAIAFGIMALAWPGLTLALLIMMFAAYAIVDGVFEIAAAVAGAAPQGRWWVLVLGGILSIAAGVLTFAYPGLTALLLLYFVAFWAIIHGVMEIAAAIHLRKVIKNEWMLILAGICSILLGGFLLSRPGAGVLAGVWIIGTMSIIVGLTLISLSLRLKGLKNRLSEAAPVV